MLKNWYAMICNYVSFEIAKRKAITLHKTDGWQYHVLPKSKGFVVLNRTQINAYNRSVSKGERIDVNDIIKISYFSTPVEGITRNINADLPVSFQAFTVGLMFFVVALIVTGVALWIL